MVDFLFLNTCKTFPFRTCLHATIIFSTDLEQIFPSRRSVWLHRNTATWTRAFHQWNCSVFFIGEKTSFSLSLFWLFQCTCRFATQQNVSRENLINTSMLYRCYDKIYSCMIWSWVPGVENERKMCSSPHTAIRWEIQLSFINLLTILTNSDENEFTERNAYLLR